MTAEERGMELLHTEMGNVPNIALEYVRYLSNKVGMCMEVMLTAFTIYAQCVENLPCSSSLYLVSEEDNLWFEDKK